MDPNTLLGKAIKDNDPKMLATLGIICTKNDIGEITHLHIDYKYNDSLSEIPTTVTHLTFDIPEND